MARHALRNTQLHVRRKARRRADPVTFLLVRARARAKQLGVPFKLRRADVHLPERCPVFSMVMTVGGGDAAPSLDRIIPELGYVPGNVVVISQRANRIKNNATLCELQQLVSFLTNTLRNFHE
jgi:hypothetical protein